MNRSLAVRAAGLGILSLFLVVPASADRVTRRDPDDTRGRLDIRSVLVHHSENRRGDEVLVHTVRTHQRWRSALLGRDATEIDIWFSNDEDARRERVIYITYRRGQLRASFNTYEEGSDFAGVGYVRDLPVSWPDARSVRVRVPLRLLSDEPLTAYHWYATTYFTATSGDVCRSAYRCNDRAPNRGYLRHDL